MRIVFFGAARTVTGAAFRIECEEAKILLDCGLFQGPRELEERNRRVDLYGPATTSAVVLSHAHMDHAGLLPAFVASGFGGPIYCTPATKDLCEILLLDSAHIQEMEAEWQTRKNLRKGLGPQKPIYTRGDVERTLPLLRPVPYGERRELAPGTFFRFQDAGHILGSASVELWAVENGTTTKLVFSGDLGRRHQALVNDPQIIEEGEVLLVESTYGDREHKSQEESVREFVEILEQAYREGEKVIIPAFAVGRTQEVLYTLHELHRKGIMPPIPVYVDSPLATAATEIFKKHPECFDGQARALLKLHDQPLELPRLIFAKTVEESRAINDLKGAAVIIAASGMANAGRILHHLKHNLWRPTAHILFIGFQAQGTLGRRIIEGAKSVKLFGEEVAVRAQIHTLGGFSAHADRRELLDWISHFKSKDMKIFVVHGEEKSAQSLAASLQEAGFSHVKVPGLMEEVDLTEPVSQEAPLPPHRELEPQDLLFLLEKRLRKLRKRLNREGIPTEAFQAASGKLRSMEEMLHEVEGILDSRS